jgi:hypothetical protein
MALKDTLGWLLDNDYFDKDDDGWCSAVKPPTEADLCKYVGCITELGRQAVGHHFPPLVRVCIDDGDPFVMKFKLASDP